MNLTDTVSLRQEFLAEKKFLSELYEISSNQSRKEVNHQLKEATDKQLNIIIVILHKVVRKEIMFYKNYYRRLRRSLAEPLLAKLDTKKETHKMLRSKRKDIIKYISHFSHLLPGFLHYLFFKQPN